MPDYLIAEMQRQRLREIDEATVPDGRLSLRVRQVRAALRARRERASR
jgi:hypothetical protein